MLPCRCCRFSTWLKEWNSQGLQNVKFEVIDSIIKILTIVSCQFVCWLHHAGMRWNTQRKTMSWWNHIAVKFPLRFLSQSIKQWFSKVIFSDPRIFPNTIYMLQPMELPQGQEVILMVASLARLQQSTTRHRLLTGSIPTTSLAFNCPRNFDLILNKDTKQVLPTWHECSWGLIPCHQGEGWP